MRTLVFLNTHLGAGYQSLINTFNLHPQIQTFDTQYHYSSLEQLLSLSVLNHKLDTSAAIYVDLILHNYRIGIKDFNEYIKFINLIVPPIYAIGEIVSFGYSPVNAVGYYCYRLRRMCELIKRNRGLIITRNNNLKAIEDFLELKTPLTETFYNNTKIDIDSDLIEKAEECFERYMYYLSQFNLLKD